MATDVNLAEQVMGLLSPTFGGVAAVTQANLEVLPASATVRAFQSLEIAGTLNLQIPSTAILEIVPGYSSSLGMPQINGYIEGVTVIGTVSTSYTLNIATGTVLTATLTASTTCVFAMPPAGAGMSFVLFLKQPAATGNGVATFTGVKWNTGGAPTITVTAGAMDILTFFADGVNWYGSYSQGYTY